MGLTSWLMTAPNWWSLASVCILECLLKSVYASKVFLAKVHMISSNTFYSTSVHLKFTFGDVSAVKGCNRCDSLSHISLRYFIMPMNYCTYLVFLGGVIFTMASTFYILVRFLSYSPKTIDIPSLFVQRMIFLYCT